MSTDLKKVVRLVEEMTRAEIMARLGSLTSDTYWYSIYIEKKDELQEYLFGSSDYVRLGIQWGLLLKENKPKNKKQYTEEDLEL